MIYVVRHGQTDRNLERKLQGRAGLPLNAQGLEQAKALKERLENVNFNVVFTSPQERAVQTAEIATSLQPVVDDRLDVFDLGEADGLLRNDVKMEGIVPDPKLYPGVENPQAFIQRVFSFMKELELNYAGSQTTILLSGHRCTTGCIGAYFLGIPDDGNILRYSSDNGEYKVYQFEVE